jgi:hypothetical protein
MCSFIIIMELKHMPYVITVKYPNENNRRIVKFPSFMGESMKFETEQEAKLYIESLSVSYRNFAQPQILELNHPYYGKATHTMSDLSFPKLIR